MAGFLPLGTPRRWTPLLRRAEPVDEEPLEDPPDEEAIAAVLEAARQTALPATARPADWARAEREAMERAEREREAEHQRLRAELDKATGTARAAAERFVALAEELAGLRRSLVAELRAQATEIIVETAVRIAGDALVVDTSLVDAMIEEAIAELGDADLTLRLSPEDAERVGPALSARKVRVLADPGLRAGCVASGPRGQIDASLDTAVAAVRRTAAPWSQA